jgi:radical SAM superfamily enzyme YgiQ (UPF0313 family)
MKILFIYPTRLDRNGRPVKFKKAFLPPLNLSILCSLTHKKHDTRIINDCVEDIDFDIDCDLVCITSITTQATRAYQIAKKFRSKEKKVILGGFHPTMMAEEAKLHADAVVIGEAENVWEQIMVDCENNRLKKFYRAADIFDMHRLIIPRWDTANLDIYYKSVGRKMPRMPIYTTRGCVHDCMYCSVSKFFGRTYRFKPIENVLQEIDATAAESYIFVDDNIICKHDYTEELLKAIKPKGIWWFSQASVKLIKQPHLIDMAANSGCKGLLLGIESLSKETLKGLKKSWNRPEIYKELFDRLKRAKIRPWVSLMFGLDEDSVESLTRTIDLLLSWDVHCIILWILTPLPGTELYQKLDGQGRINVREWSEYDSSHVVFQPKNFSPSELDDFYWSTYRRLHTAHAIFKKAKLSVKTGYNPVKDFINGLVFHSRIRKKIIEYDHPFSMGLGRL